MTNDLIDRVLKGEDPDAVLDDALAEGRVGDLFRSGGAKSRQLCKLFAEFFYINQEDLDLRCIIQALEEVAIAHRVGGRKGAALYGSARLIIRAMERHMAHEKQLEKQLSKKKAATCVGPDCPPAPKKRVRAAPRKPPTRRKTTRRTRKKA